MTMTDLTDNPTRKKESIMLMLTCNTDNDIDVIEVEEGKTGNAIRDAVGGLYDCIHIPSLGVDMWINDEGKLEGLPINANGTALWVSQYGMTDIIVGNIVVTGGVDEQGNTLGIDVNKIIEVLELANNTMQNLLSNSSSETNSSRE